MLSQQAQRYLAAMDIERWEPRRPLPNAGLSAEQPILVSDRLSEQELALLKQVCQAARLDWAELAQVKAQDYAPQHRGLTLWASKAPAPAGNASLLLVDAQLLLNDGKAKQRLWNSLWPLLSN